MALLKIPEKLCVNLGRNVAFVVFGCGGTGSYFVRDLARIVGIYAQQNNRRDRILLMDGDTVEDSNLRRQNFIMSDLGKNKAEVLAQRYSRSFGADIAYLPEYLKPENTYKVLEFIGSSPCVLVGCVDNNKTRHIIHSIYNRLRGGYPAVYLDSGNEEYAGQVVFSINEARTCHGTRLTFKYGYKIKDAVELFDLEPTDKHPEEMSCAEHAVHAPQNIATNMMAAQVLFNYINIIYASTIAYEEIGSRTGMSIEQYIEEYKNIPGISAHVTYFNSRTGTISTQPFDDEVSNVIRNARESFDEQVGMYSTSK